ncbi:MAG: AbrB/MazE/SpoVT family DNA-binding domain-containing protein [Candidatus Bathyarchaeota archaeon]|nr:AbrB/MazE/SpoVT family DNA-binding domain-containing protein [Candidatus Termiticorpusculum sp.]MCL2868779.1 AbrB/MazE/SpoVT family DNA-binding domain-containing protein [Candidatus Termiticorpusculum sp.]
MSQKGQVVIPQTLRKQLDLTPKTKLLIYKKDNLLILKKLEIPDIKKEWDNIFAMMDKKNLKLSEAEIQQEIDAVRTAKRQQ